jgi:hypothetical protein
MVENGHDVAVIEYHSGDDYQNSYGTARLSYYNVTGFPTVKFDGILSQVGASGDMYPSYLSKYNQRINVMSDYTIEVTGSNSGLIEYEIEVTVEKVGSGGINNPRLQVAVTETDIPEFWGGLSEVNWVERLMVPNQNGTTLDFSGSITEEISLSFSVDPSWVFEKCAIVVFLQNHTSKEILQGTEYMLSAFETSNTNDAALLSAAAPVSVCNNIFSPVIEIANYGMDNLTSLDIVYEVNSGTPITHNWTGNLSYMETTMVELPEISFNIQPNNSFSIECENPNGMDDEYPSNNSQSTSFSEALEGNAEFTLMLKPDNNPEETSWEILDSQGDVLHSGGDYTTSSPIFLPLELTYADCYSFVIYDEGGDGLTGSGTYALFYGSPATYFVESVDFKYMAEHQFSIDVTGIHESELAGVISINPNPIVKEAVISFVLESPELVSMKVYNSVGTVVYQTEPLELSAGNQSVTFKRNDLESGIYFINIQQGNKRFTEKVILK